MAEREDRAQRLAAAGTWLVEARKRAGLTQQQLADAVETTDQSISNYERGVAAVPDDIAQGIARALDLGVIETRRGLRLWVPEDAVDPEPSEVNVLRELRRDPHLLPHLRNHIVNQYKILREASQPPPAAEPDEDIRDLPYVARKRSPRKPRS